MSARASGSASSSASRRGSSSLSPLEKRVYKAIHSAPNQTLTQSDAEVKLSDIGSRDFLETINNLLKKSLLSVQNGERGIQYVATSTKEASMLGSMDTDEAVVYRFIRDAGTEGIWTKMLKPRTGLHQTVMLKALKSLEGKGQIKSVKSVKNPTRKIYMLANLTPSVELSGGPWYTDNELDTAFIAGLSNVCLKFIQDKTWPSGHREGDRRLYPSSYTKYLPTAVSILEYLQKSSVTSVKLDITDMQDLLETMVYDEKIEKVAILGGAATGGPPKLSNGAAAAEDVDDWAGHSSEKKRSSKSNGESKSRRKSKSSHRSKRRRRHESISASESDSETDSTSGSESASSSESDSASDSESESESDVGDRRRKSGKRKRSNSSRSSSRKKSKSSSSKSKNRSRKSSKSQKSRKSRSRSRRSDSDESSSSSSEEDDEADESSSSDEEKNVRSSKSTSRKAKSVKLESEPEIESDEDLDRDMHSSASLFVYRALPEAYVQTGFTETPCARCPVFDFCRPDGPVNASCVYYGQWIEGGLEESDGDDEAGDDENEGDWATGARPPPRENVQTDTVTT